MTCEEIRNMIDREGALVTGDAQSHVHDCADCAETWRRWQEVQRGLRAFNEEETPAFLHTRIMAHVRDAEAKETEKKGAWLFGLKKIWAGPILVLFIGVVLGGYGVVQVFHNKKPEAQAPAAAQEGPTGKAKKDALPPKGTAPATALEDKHVPASQLPPVQVETAARPSAPSPAVQPGVAQGGAAPKEESADELFAPSPAAAGPPAAASRETLASRPSTQDTPEGAVAGNMAVRRQDTRDEAEKRAEPSGFAPSPTPSSSDDVSEVVCTLSSLSGSGPYITLQLPPQAAPPSGGIWMLEVTEDGGVRIQDALGKPLSAPVATVAAVVRPLHVPPGGYRLKRIS